jgi:addiction module HigA family antidote
MPNQMRPIHPGEILRGDMDELQLSAQQLAKALGVPTNRITALIHETRASTADMALRLARYFGPPRKFGPICKRLMTYAAHSNRLVPASPARWYHAWQRVKALLQVQNERTCHERQSRMVAVRDCVTNAGLWHPCSCPMLCYFKVIEKCDTINRSLAVYQLNNMDGPP